MCEPDHTCEPEDHLPVRSIQFQGIRGLNWAEREPETPYGLHSRTHGFDETVSPGRLLVLVGPNGGGKTTVLDLLRGLGDASMWPTLPRENQGIGFFSGFEVAGAGFSMNVRFEHPSRRQAHAADAFVASVSVPSDVATSPFEVLIPKFPKDDEWSRDLRKLLDDRVRIVIRDFEAPEHQADEIGDQEFAELLDEVSGHLWGVGAGGVPDTIRPYRGHSPRPQVVGIRSEAEPTMHSFVHRDRLPSGWKRLVALLHFVRRSPSGALVLFDEPDRHLHPGLQRVMFEKVADDGKRLGLQIIMATHSSVLLDPELGRRLGATIAVVSRGRCEKISNSRRLLDDLGVRSADLVQTNGVIWVEGPSDRLYIKTWLEARAQDTKRAILSEGTHYVFVSYGGSLLAHLGLTRGQGDRLDLRSVNRNLFLVIDSDIDVDGTPEAILGAQKRRVLDEAERDGADVPIWITRGYTIESYLGEPWSADVTTRDGRTVVLGPSKVALARRYRDARPAWDAAAPHADDLARWIDRLLDAIARWQDPEEVGARPPAPSAHAR